MKYFFFLSFGILLNFTGFSQVGINNTDPKASLDITATNQATPSNTDGLLIPRIDDFPATPPTAAQQGMMVYLTTASGGNAPGYYYWDNNAGPAAWVSVVGSTVGKLDDLSDGKSDSDGTNDGSSVFLGINAGANDDSSNNSNVGIGYLSLNSNTTGTQNTAVGSASLSSNTTGFNNTAIGQTSLYTNTTGYGNTTIGVNSLLFNTTGNYNTSLGVTSLRLNTTGERNTAIGAYSLYSNTTGSSNTANGIRSLYFNTTGTDNIASGRRSLYSNTTGSFNTSLGYYSGYNATGSSNVFLGSFAGYSETGSNKLYIENSNTNQDNALIYGEFDTNILRTNGELQIGKPTGTGYAFPTIDGSVNQILQTDGNGQLSFTTRVDGAQKLDDLIDGKSDSDGTNDGSSVFLGINAGTNDDSSNNRNVGIGFEALNSNTIGFNNTANGYQSLYSNTTSYNNTANGYQSLYSNTTGYNNTANGYQSIYSNTTGLANTAIGYYSLYSNMTGTGNNAMGWRALYDNTVGDSNTAIGNNSLDSNTTGNFNTALGNGSGANNLSGSSNVFLGNQSGINELGSNTLYIENSNADSDNALIYGEFDTNILRTNGELQIGNPTGTGYAFPTTDGNVSQILQTDGNGQLSFTTRVDGAQKLDDLIDGKSDNDGTNNYSSVFLGYLAGFGDDSTDNRNVGIGFQALAFNTTGLYNAAFGYFTLKDNSNGDYNTAIGNLSLNSLTTGSNNTALGYLSGSTILTGSGNIFIGYQSGLNELGSNTLYIENSNANSNSALIYGEFDTNILRINGELQIGSLAGITYSFPTLDGTANQVLYTDGSGNINWINQITDTDDQTVDTFSLSGTTLNISLQDDGVVPVTVDLSSLQDGGALRIDDLLDGKSDNDGTDNNSSLFLGFLAGISDDSTDNRNVGVGYFALSSNTIGEYNAAFGYNTLDANTTGNYNTAIGNLSLSSIISGDNNTALGRSAGGSNILGSGNVFLGYSSGFNETGSEKLYIDNSGANADGALIYGEFDTNILRTNSQFQIGNPTVTGYAFPTTDGTLNQLMYTDGNGALSWINSTLLGTDDQTIDQFNLSGTTLGISLENDGVAPLTVDLSSLQDGGALKIDDLLDGKSDNDGTNDGSSIYLGTNAGAVDDVGDNRNVGIGYESLKANTSGAKNNAIGHRTLLTNTTGSFNIAIGNSSQYLNLSGNGNTSIGESSLYNNSTGNYNTAIGEQSLYTNKGLSNTAIGQASLKLNSTGNLNTVIGYSAGLNNLGSGNVFIGGNAATNEIGSNKLYIENSSANSDNALIYGEFDTKILRTNSQFQIGNPTGTGYAFPTADGTSNQLLYTDGNGALSWINTSFLGTDDQNLTGATLTGTTLAIAIENGTGVTVDLSSLQDADWHETGGLPPNDINDNIYTQGNVAIGDTSASYRLDVTDSQASNYVVRINNTSTGTDADGLVIRLANSLNPSSNNYFIAFNSGIGINRGSISGNGTGGVNYATTSDRRLKTHIISIDNPFSIIDNIQPRLYEYKANLGTKEYGFIAQELQLVYPQAVSGDPNGNVETNPMMVDYSRLTPILTAGVKELKQEVETLKKENQQLKKQLKKYADLEARLSALENNTSVPIN